MKKPHKHQLDRLAVYCCKCTGKKGIDVVNQRRVVLEEIVVATALDVERRGHVAESVAEAELVGHLGSASRFGAQGDAVASLRAGSEGGEDEAVAVGDRADAALGVFTIEGPEHLARFGIEHVAEPA
mgnify:CR=1 FL=1